MLVLLAAVWLEAFHFTLFQVFQYRNRLLGDHDVPLACVEQLVTGRKL